MKEDNIIREKSFDFAVNITKLRKYLYDDKKEFVLSRQLLRSGTSIGANIEEAIGGQSSKDFLAKITIAYKETRETIYWLKLLYATEYLTKQQSENISKEANEICKILGKIQTTMKNKVS
ncbi:MAG: four helix bundle protein [Endomicrobia bacterium]|nr:four helix bundle protein [Endomicrobiia bacterium]MCL2800107.1 four helix bundle protein [Endomicrobiia bacterium]